MNYLSDKSYLAIGKQSAQGTPVKPSVFVPLIDADLKTDPKPTRVKQIAGINWASNKVLQGVRSHSGSITVQCDPDTLGYLLDILALKGTTTGDGSVGYTHPFDILTEGNYFTFEVLKGNSVVRMSDVKIKKIEFSFADGYLEAKIDIVAGSAFTGATLASALSSSITAVPCDILYDITPLDNLVAGDVIQIWHAGVATDITITTISADKRSANCSSTACTASKGDLVSLKAQTPSYANLLRPFKFGRVLVGFGVDMATALSNAGAYASATALDDLKISLDKGIIENSMTGKENPVILAGVPDGTMTIKKLFSNASEAQAYQDIAKQCAVIIFTGDEITAGYPASLTMKFYDLKVAKNDNKIKKGEYIYDETEFTIEYSNADAKSMDIVIVNKTAGASL